MILRVLAVSMIGFTLAGCVSSSGLSGDVYSASEAKQVQSVTYGTIVHTRAVQIQSGDDSNAIGAIGGAVLGGFLGNTIGGGTGRSLATAAGAVAVAAAGSLLSSTPLFSGVGAPRKPPLFTGAPTLSSGFSVLLLIGRTSVGAGWFMPAASPPSRFGRAGRA